MTRGTTPAQNGRIAQYLQDLNNMITMEKSFYLLILDEKDEV
ncbi:MAG: hypothetical protein ACLU4J_20900 [Butyricimonas paravirosa]